MSEQITHNPTVGKARGKYVLWLPMQNYLLDIAHMLNKRGLESAQRTNENSPPIHRWGDVTMKTAVRIADD